jgi:HlyD family secretion protein
MKASRYRILLVALIIIGVGVLIWYTTRPKPLPVSVTQVEKGTVEATVSNTRAGTVKACRRARLAPAIGGQIAQLYVKKGDHVTTGQLLLSLWNDDLEAQKLLAQRETIAARASAEQTCLLADNAQREARRLEDLLKNKQVSEQQADTASTQARAQQAACQAARANVEVSTARVAVASAAVERTLLRAPFTGVVGEINGELGEFVTPSPTGVATLPAVDLFDTSCLYISAPIDEVDAPQVKTDMTARITLDAFPNKSFAGRVNRIAPYVLEVEKQARTVEVEALFTEPEDYQRLLPGYSADLEIIINTRKDVLRIPTEAVLEGHRVLVYNPATQLLEERSFNAGLSNWKYTEVLSGLSAGETIVTSIDREGVKAGARVTLENSTSSK